jgi:Protein of unknown function (DUF2510)
LLVPVTMRREVREPRGGGDAVGLGVVLGALIGAVGGVAPALSVNGTAAPAIVLLLGMFGGVCLGGLVGLLIDRRRPLAVVPPPAPAEPLADPRLTELAPPGLVGPGWYDDPLGDTHRRYWDGEAWTVHVWRRD